MARRILLSEVTPFKATHVGEVLKEELKARNIKQKDIAALLNQPASVINQIIKETRGITPDMAILLEKALNIKASFWMKLQSNYELDMARIQEKTQKNARNIELWQSLGQLVPLKEFQKAGVISENIEQGIKKTFEIFQVDNIDELIELKSADPQVAMFRKSAKLNTNQINLFGWKHLAYYNARSDNKQYPAFNRDNYQAIIQELNTIFYDNDHTLDKLHAVLYKYGIRFTIQKRFNQTPIDGFSFMHKGTPTIVVTTRLNRIDNLAFSVMHELCHVFSHLGTEGYNDLVALDDENRAKNKYEKEADAYARKALISDEIWQQFIHLGKATSPHQMYVVAGTFSRRYKIHPAILMGAYMHEMNRYNIKGHFDKEIH